MKILTILLILLQINTFGYGNYSSPYSSNYNSYSSESYRENRYRGIGYTTNYSNGQFNSGVYKSSTATFEYQNRTFTGTYNPSLAIEDNADFSSPNGPIKAPPGERVLYSGYVTVDGVTVYWEITGTDILGIGGNYKIYVDGALVDSGWMWNSEAQRKAKEEAQKVAEEKAHSTPIGDAVVPFLILLLIYIGYDIFKKKHNKQ